MIGGVVLQGLSGCGPIGDCRLVIFPSLIGRRTSSGLGHLATLELTIRCYHLLADIVDIPLGPLDVRLPIAQL